MEKALDHNDETRWAQLMSQAQQGDKKAYESLLKELSKAITAYLRVRFGTQEFIEDCVQESLLAIHQARGSYDDKRPFRPWVFAIVRHKTIDILRKTIRYRKNLQQQTEDTIDTKQQNMEATINSTQLLTALSPQHREALTLTKFIGLSTSEAASTLDITESAMKLRVHRAIAHTRKLLEADRV